MKEISGINGLKKYYDQERVIENYEEERFKEFSGKLLDMLEREAVAYHLVDIILNSEKILEIPVGTGRITKTLEKISNNEIICADTSQKMLRHAKTKLRKNHKFVCCSITNLSFKRKFDIVFTFRLLRHFKLKEREKIFGEIKNILKDGGFLVFDVPCLIGHKKIDKKDRFIYDAYYTAEKLKKELVENRLKLIETYPVYVFPPFLSMVMNPFYRRFIKSPNDKISKISKSILLNFQKIMTRYKLFPLRSKQWVVLCRLST